MATLENRLAELERSAPQPARIVVLFPDMRGNYPEPPPEVVQVIRVEYVKAAHAKP